MFNKNNFPTYPKIPEITNRLGKFWKQPPKHRVDRFEFGGTEDAPIVRITQKDFDTLEFYASSSPSGLYQGKMWRTKTGKKDVLCFVIEDPSDADMVFIHKCFIEIAA